MTKIPTPPPAELVSMPRPTSPPPPKVPNEPSKVEIVKEKPYLIGMVHTHQPSPITWPAYLMCFMVFLFLIFMICLELYKEGLLW